MTDTWKKFAYAHAKKCEPAECCGMLIKKEDNIIESEQVIDDNKSNT